MIIMNKKKKMAVQVIYGYLTYTSERLTKKNKILEKIYPDIRFDRKNICLL